MHAGLSTVLMELAELRTQTEHLTMLVQDVQRDVRQDVLPRLQSEYGVQRSSVFGQQPAGVTATIHGAFALPHALRRAGKLRAEPCFLVIAVRQERKYKE